jgi:hypothetical protein
VSNVTPIKAEKSSDVIASSLQAMAEQIAEAGTATRAILIVAEREPGRDKQSMIFFGPDTPVTELVGMLEIAKIEAVTSE